MVLKKKLHDHRYVLLFYLNVDNVLGIKSCCNRLAIIDLFTIIVCFIKIDIFLAKKNMDHFFYFLTFHFLIYLTKVKKRKK